jgi:hypothetical protein
VISEPLPTHRFVAEIRRCVFLRKRIGPAPTRRHLSQKQVFHPNRVAVSSLKENRRELFT